MQFNNSENLHNDFHLFWNAKSHSNVYSSHKSEQFYRVLCYALTETEQVSTIIEGSSETITPSPTAALTLKPLLPLPDKEQDEADVQGEDEHPDNAHHQDDNHRRLVRALQVWRHHVCWHLFVWKSKS